MSARLEGKVCIITGTGGSMGRTSALAFAREGASIVGCDLDVDAAQATVELVRGAAGEMASMHPCHLTDPADCQALIELAIGTFGRVDVLSNHGPAARWSCDARSGIGRRPACNPGSRSVPGGRESG